MSAILSADDLNDFISPGVACIKPIETLPARDENQNEFEVTTEDSVAAANAPPAQISLTDCLACSGCVTSAEAVLVSLQSHQEVLNTLDAYRSLEPSHLFGMNGHGTNGANWMNGTGTAVGGKLFVASVSPQTRASLAATLSITEKHAAYLIEQILSGPQGVRAGGVYGSHFSWVMDTNAFRELALVVAADEVTSTLYPQLAPKGSKSPIPSSVPKKPILTSACPGWICYAEKTHPYVLPNLSRLKSPQALGGTLVKSILSQKYGIAPQDIWHLALMPCFDKKLEASRSELTGASWSPEPGTDIAPVRDVDCVITAHELLQLASARGIDIASLPLKPVAQPPFPDPVLSSFIFSKRRTALQSLSAGTSGGYLHHILHTLATHHPNADIRSERGRNADVVEYRLVDRGTGSEVVKMARYYGFRNIQNLVRRLKPKAASRMPGAVVRRGPAARNGDAASSDYAYVEVMACPGGCTNGGGQVKVDDVAAMKGETNGNAVVKPGVKEQKEWLAKVDEAYFSAESSASEDDEDAMDIDSPASAPHLNGNSTDIVNGISQSHIRSILFHWSEITNIPLDKLVYTSYREVESDVGKKTSKKSDVERVAGLAQSMGGGW